MFEEFWSVAFVEFVLRIFVSDDAFFCECVVIIFRFRVVRRCLAFLASIDKEFATLFLEVMAARDLFVDQVVGGCEGVWSWELILCLKFCDLHRLRFANLFVPESILPRTFCLQFQVSANLVDGRWRHMRLIFSRNVEETVKLIFRHLHIKWLVI